MKKIYYLLLLCSVQLVAQNVETFEKANAAYNKGDYDTAVKMYEEVLESGEASTALYYNLGNVHYKLNNIAPSIYYYEKALQLSPKDDDVLNNLKFAQNMAIDEIEVVPTSGIAKLFNSIIGGLGFNGWAWAAIICAFIFAIAFLLYYFSSSTQLKRAFFTVSIIGVILCILSLGFAFQQKSLALSNKFAIVFEEEAPVRNEPNLRSEEVFVLHEGTKAKILNSYQEWVKIELENGAQGWLYKSAVKFL